MLLSSFSCHLICSFEWRSESSFESSFECSFLCSSWSFHAPYKRAVFTLKSGRHVDCTYHKYAHAVAYLHATRTDERERGQASAKQQESDLLPVLRALRARHAKTRRCAGLQAELACFVH